LRGEWANPHRNCEGKRDADTHALRKREKEKYIRRNLASRKSEGRKKGEKRLQFIFLIPKKKKERKRSNV